MALARGSLAAVRVRRRATHRLLLLVVASRPCTGLAHLQAQGLRVAEAKRAGLSAGIRAAWRQSRPWGCRSGRRWRQELRPRRWRVSDLRLVAAAAAPASWR